MTTTPKDDQTDDTRPPELRKMIEDLGEAIERHYPLTDDEKALLDRAKSYYDRPANFSLDPDKYFETTAELAPEVEVEGW